MAITGKKFPNITVPAINSMGDNIEINVLEEAISMTLGLILALSFFGLFQEVNNDAFKAQIKQPVSAEITQVQNSQLIK